MSEQARWPIPDAPAANESAVLNDFTAVWSQDVAYDVSFQPDLVSNLDDRVFLSSIRALEHEDLGSSLNIQGVVICAADCQKPSEGYFAGRPTFRVPLPPTSSLVRALSASPSDQLATLDMVMDSGVTDVSALMDFVDTHERVIFVSRSGNTRTAVAALVYLLARYNTSLCDAIAFLHQRRQFSILPQYAALLQLLSLRIRAELLDSSHALPTASPRRVAVAAPSTSSAPADAYRTPPRTRGPDGQSKAAATTPTLGGQYPVTPVTNHSVPSNTQYTYPQLSRSEQVQPRAYAPEASLDFTVVVEQVAPGQPGHHPSARSPQAQDASFIGRVRNMMRKGPAPPSQ